MKYIAYITHVPTGETRKIEDDYPDEYLDGIECMWSEGNFGCDCNRAVYFFDEDNDHPCGDTVFKVSHLELANGTIIQIQGP